MTGRILAVQWQMDVDAPVEQGKIRYAVEPLQTTIIFPTGKKRTFPNWDVKGCRRAHYEDQWVNITTEEMLAATGTKVMEYGITPDEVRLFVANLAKKPMYEELFFQPSPALPNHSEEFEQIITTLAQGAGA